MDFRKKDSLDTVEKRKKEADQGFVTYSRARTIKVKLILPGKT